MSNPIVRYAIARENGFFKVEQEADIQRHRQRMVNAGHIEDIARGSFGPKRTQTFEQSAKTFEVLAEVLQQQARVDATDAAQRQIYERKVRGELPMLTEAEMQRYRSALYGVAAAVGHAPRMSLAGRHRYGELYASGGGVAPPKETGTWSPEAREAARRTYMAGARSLFYGSALGLGGVVLIGSLALRILDVRSPADLRERMQSAVQPLGANVRETLSPMKKSMQATIQAWTGFTPGSSDDPGNRAGPDTEFTRSLGRRLHRRVGGQMQEISSINSERDRS
ncbi:g9698 [Coccomyxa viridis]|uniref:G9698 protein n=1 Tax=Coccomyxa viridis TaxID=1274662 RepID=A0ABP1G3Y7_9CHLO